MRLALFSTLLASRATAQQAFSTSNWQGQLAAGSGVLQSMRPVSDTSFDFSPSDDFPNRNGVGNYHTGDLAIQWRQAGQTAWTMFDTAQLRNTNPISSKSSGSLLHSDFSNVSPTTAGKLNITRDWIQDGPDLVLQATVTVPKGAKAVELGSFGFPIEFNNIFTNRSADEVTAQCSLVDPYIGLAAGYLQVTRLGGNAPHMVVTPSNFGTKFEGWRFLTEFNGAPYYYQSTGFEGLYSWEVLTQAWVDTTWSSTDPWNPPTSAMLQPGQSVTYGLRFTPTPQLYDIESTVAALGHPVAVGLPGYVLPGGTTSLLLLNYTTAVSEIYTIPANALKFTKTSVPDSKLKAYQVTANDGVFGRVQTTINYANGIVQTVHYFVTASQPQTADNYAAFSFKNSYFQNTSDPFHRYGLITYDSIANQQVLQDPRTWIAGQADEAGSQYEGLSMKESAHPDPTHIHQLESMVNHSIWGNLQNHDYSVKRSLFFYQPSAEPSYPYSTSINWGGSWSESDAYATWRAYDYVHASAIYYALYRASRVSPGILTFQTPMWYLNQAFHTVVASQNQTAYADVGLMAETMWVHLLQDLIAEGLSSQAAQITQIMKGRQALWATQSDPFGSEMQWDSTGEEGVYAWSRYFNDQTTMTKCLDYIRGYMPTVAHWGWNGNARRYWDFLYGGKLPQIERMIHHYGSSLNALPLLDNYKYQSSPASPAVFYDLRVAFGGIMGPLSNINAAGMTSTAFHSYPDTMIWDGYSGDYGPTYNGHIMGSGTFLVQHPSFGWVAMGGKVNSVNPVSVTPTDTVQRSIYVAAMGLAVQFDAGKISGFVYDPSAKTLRITLVQAESVPAKTTIMTYQSTLGQNIKLTTGNLPSSKGGHVVKLPGSVSFSA